MNARDGRCGQSRKLPMSWVGYVPTALPHTNSPGHRGGDRTIGIRGRTGVSVGFGAALLLNLVATAAAYVFGAVA